MIVRLVMLVLGLGLAVGASADPLAYDLGARSSLQYLGQLLPENSALRQSAGATANDLNFSGRLTASAVGNGWNAQADYQLLALHGDSVEFSRGSGGAVMPAGRLPDDRRRWFDLTHVMRDRDETAVLHRLDRLYLGYTGDKVVLRAGRQALSWGNGLVFAPMDIVNPFDPTAIDKEYKTGDDMVYGQLLRDNGDDLQAAVVVRRDPLSGDVESDQFTYALKYHGMLQDAEFDLLLARNYGEGLFALGGNREFGGAVWRADAVAADTASEGLVWQFVTSLSYSWEWGGKNVSGVAEYFYNGFGQSDSCYSGACLAANTELLNRLSRGELFSLGRHYVAASAAIELTPLFVLTPSLFWNLRDDSALLQLNTRHDLAQNLVLLGSIGLPLGPSGSEFGGVPAPAPGLYFSNDLSVFLQLNWYY